MVGKSVVISLSVTLQLEFAGFVYKLLHTLHTDGQEGCKVQQIEVTNLDKR